jgi:hypothetical protein
MDLNQQPQRKKPLPLRLQDLKETITSGSKRPAKSKKVNKIAKNQLPNIDECEKINDNLKPEVHEDFRSKTRKFQCENCGKVFILKTIIIYI